MRKLICAFIMLCHTNLLFADCKLIDYVKESIVTNSTLDVTNLTKYLLEQKRKTEENSFVSLKERKCVDDSFSLFMEKLNILTFEPQRPVQIQISQLLKLFSDVAQNLWVDVSYDLDGSDVEGVFASLGKLKSTGKMISYDLFCSWMSDTAKLSPYQEFLISLMSDYVERINVGQVFKLNSCLESSSKHKSVLLKILSLGVMKGAYDYSSVAFRKKVYENEAVLASLRKRFDGLNPESSNYKILLRKIKFFLNFNHF